MKYILTASMLCLFQILSAYSAIAQAPVEIWAAVTPTQAQIDSVKASGSGISGAGKPIMGDGYGGMCSGKFLTEADRPKYANGSVIKNGLIPNIHPIWDVHMRDAVITLGGDGNYYLTGSTGDNIWKYNDGVELYQSLDLIHWKYLGLVWSIEKDGGWEKFWRQRPKGKVRAVWAPEIHYIHYNYYICLSMPPGGIAILKSSTGKPTGPYVHATDPNKPLLGGIGPIPESFLIDPSLFEDEDGKVYFVQGPADKIYPMKPDLSGFDGPPIQVKLLNPDTDPTLRRDTNPTNQLGFEGATLFKRKGIYYLGSTDKYKGRYSMCLAMSKNIAGPYALRHESVPCNGGTKFFRAKNGDWYTCLFGDDSNAPWREKPGILKIDFAPDGKVIVAKDQPPFILNPPTVPNK